jgi:hypothetical protein
MCNPSLSQKFRIPINDLSSSNKRRCFAMTDWVCKTAKSKTSAGTSNKHKISPHSTAPALIWKAYISSSASQSQLRRSGVTERQGFRLSSSQGRKIVNIQKADRRETHSKHGTGDRFSAAILPTGASEKRHSKHTGTRRRLANLDPKP